MRILSRSGKAGTLLSVLDTVICYTESLSELKGMIPQQLQVLLAVSLFWELLLSEESQLTLSHVIFHGEALHPRLAVVRVQRFSPSSPVQGNSEGSSHIRVTHGVS